MLKSLGSYTLLVLLINVLLVRSWVNVDLYDDDFKNGTFRILESGEYHIREDINFGPMPENDYWNDPRDTYYPIQNYYMGFFAAITVEVSNVEIYLHGYTIAQTKEFYLLQRFFNTIQLNDKIFVHNEGVSPLNYQNGDNVTYSQSQVVGDLVTVKNIQIRDGTIGLTSHIGIHGNGARNVLIKDVVVNDFEVAGIQCNGCKRVVIHKCTVGPTSRQVPALATFSNARFFDLFVNRIIPFGFAYDGVFSADLLNLLNENIQFADRTTPVSIKDVFTRLERATTLFRNYTHMEYDSQYLSSDDQALLQEANRVFSNPGGLTDGGVVYGIVINKLGLPHSDDNFFGSGYESGNIIIQKTNIVGLHARPAQVPGLQTVGGDFIQGPARDVLRIFDIGSDKFRTLRRTKYKGNFLSDVYFALWKLSNEFYRTRIYDSECGNFGSNATMPYAINPEHADQCLGGTVRDISLTGRKVTLFQKRYFGGLTMSQGVYDWATTPGMTLDTILASPQAAPDLRMNKHYITCGIDTMFHDMQGIIGIKILETKNVKLKKVTISDILNKGDASNWICDQIWKLPETGEVIMINNHGLEHMEGPFIKGVQIIKSTKIQFRNVDIKDLYSDEGNVFGIQVKDDLSDRSDYDDGKGLSFDMSYIGNLTSGGISKAFDLSGTAISPSNGLTIGDHEELHNGFLNPKVSFIYGFTNTTAPDFFGPALYPVAGGTFPYIEDTFTQGSEEKLKEFRSKGFDYFRIYYGLEFGNYDEDAELEDVQSFTVLHPDGTPSDSIVAWFAFSKDMKYGGLSLCFEDECSDLLADTLLIDCGYSIFVGSEGLVTKGRFGGDQGQYMPPGSNIFVGYYSIENINFPGIEGNIEIEYYPICPITPGIWDDGTTIERSVIVNCELESGLFGKGLATGSLNYRYVPGTIPEWNVNGYSVMVFDDIVDFPEPSQITTNYNDDNVYQFPSNLFSVWADGALPTADFSHHLFPLVSGYHFVDESATKYMLENTKYNSEALLRTLRKQFLTRLRDDYGIPNVNPDGFDDIASEAIVDLGGGNRVQAYEVNDIANLRLLAHVNSSSGKTRGLPKGSRIREAGFRLVMGRAGMDTNWGHLPQGTLFVEGVWILENTEYEGSRVELDIYSNLPVSSDWWSSGVIDNTVTSELYGTGRSLIAVTAPVVHDDGKHINIRGTIFFE